MVRVGATDKPEDDRKHVKDKDDKRSRDHRRSDRSRRESGDGYKKRSYSRDGKRIHLGIEKVPKMQELYEDMINHEVQILQQDQIQEEEMEKGQDTVEMIEDLETEKEIEEQEVIEIVTALLEVEGSQMTSHV